jgi:hypothetical protein
MSPKRRQYVLLAVLGAVLAAAVYVRWPRAAERVPIASNVRGAARPAQGQAAMTAPDVHLEQLRAPSAKPTELERNLFKFKPRPAPAPSPVRDPIAPPPPVVSTAPPPPSVPPITLKFIGLIETGSAQRVAILSDGRGSPVYGKEGDTVLGQYKILRIGVESIEMAYLDGRGRQTIRLSGS